MKVIRRLASYTICYMHACAVGSDCAQPHLRAAGVLQGSVQRHHLMRHRGHKGVGLEKLLAAEAHLQQLQPAAAHRQHANTACDRLPHLTSQLGSGQPTETGSTRRC